MRIHLGSDHAGYAMKESLKPYLLDKGVELTDVGTTSEESVDYPDFAEARRACCSDQARPTGGFSCAVRASGCP